MLYCDMDSGESECIVVPTFSLHWLALAGLHFENPGFRHIGILKINADVRLMLVQFPVTL